MKNMNYQVIDNFLEKDYYEYLKEMFHSVNISWFWQHYQIGKDSPFLSHEFIFNNEKVSPLVSELMLFISKLKPNTILNLRANMTPNMFGNGFCKKHTDTNLDDHTTAIFYLGTNNGATILCPKGEEEIEIKTVDNRLLMFDCNIEHYSKHATDVDRRIVLNINYYA